MVTIKKRRQFFSLTEYWFDYRIRLADVFLPVCYRGIWDTKRSFYLGVKKHTSTVVLPLDKPEEAIYDAFSPDIKRNIKKAEVAGVQCYSHNDIKGFIEFYNQFAGSKNLQPLDIKRMNEFSGEEWGFSYAVLDGDILAAFSNIEDQEKKIVRGIQGASLQKSDKYTQRQIGAANKLLYYYNIKHYRQRGMRWYDFGGWNNIPSLLEFKQSFGAYPIHVVNYLSYTYYLKEKIQNLLRFFPAKQQQKQPQYITGV
jgi:hypothetical protein